MNESLPQFLMYELEKCGNPAKTLYKLLKQHFTINHLSVYIETCVCNREYKNFKCLITEMFTNMNIPFHTLSRSFQRALLL